MEKIRAIKKIKRQCMVRGCKNRESYSVSCSRELGNSIHICEECAKGIVFAIGQKYPVEVSDNQKNSENAENSTPATEEKQEISETATKKSPKNKTGKTKNEAGK